MDNDGKVQGEGSFAFERFPDEQRWACDVRFEKLSFVTNVDKKKNKDRGPVNVVESMFQLGKVFRAKEDVYVLKDLNGTLKAGTSTLLLGPGRSGKSVFMKVLAGQIKSKNGISGSIQFGGIEQNELQMARVCSYVGQVDTHLPLLDVKSTLTFAEECAGQSQAFKGRVDEVIDKFGLRRCATTVVGNELLKGISGGEKKRLTLAELMFHRRPVLLCDEITTGLDSSTAYNIVKLLNESARSLQSTVLMSLLQPSPDLIKLFDQVILMCEGRFVYHGPVADALPYFEKLGYVCPKGRGLGEFLLDMATEGCRERYLAQGKQQCIACSGLAELVIKTFNSNSDEITVDEEASRSFLKDQSPFVLGTLADWKVVIERQFHLLYKDRMIVAALITQVSLISVVAGFLFLSIPLGPDSTNVSTLDLQWLSQRLSALFFSVVVYSLNSFAMLPFNLNQRNVFYKQRKTQSFFRTFGFVLGSAVTSLFTSIMEVLAGTSIVFWLVDMIDKNASDAIKTFVFFNLVALSYNLAIGSLIKLVGFCARTVIEALLYGVMVLATVLLFCGFIILKEDISPWLIWIYWLSPVSWAFRSISIVVFSSETFKSQGLTSTSLEFMDLPEEEWWIFAGIAYLLGFYLIAVVCQAFVLEYFRFGEPTFVDPGWRTRVRDDTTSSKLEAQIRPVSSGIGLEDPNDNLVMEKRSRRSTLASKMSQLLGNDDDGVDDEVEEMMSQVEEDELDLAVLSNEVAMETLDTNFSKAVLTFENICYTVKLKNGKRKQLLNSISGFAAPGRMTALIGSTGAGKTTLLNVLSMRANAGVISGKILVNGRSVPKSVFRRLLAYVEQEDHHSANATVKEAISFSAALRLPKGTTTEFQTAFVDEIMKTLAIENLANRQIGKKGVGAGLSVQQFKRLSVAVELASNPSILALDEPTSGLSAMEAEIVINAVRRVAMSGRTVLCTIHQPSREVYAKFDQTIVLKPGGSLVYCGPAQEQMVGYFTNAVSTVADESTSFLRYNPSAFALELVLVYSDKVDFPQLYEDSHFCADTEAEIEFAVTNGNDDILVPIQPPSIFFKFLLSMERWNLIYWRSFNYNGVRFLSTLAFGAFLGLTYFNKNEVSDPGNVASLVGVLFYATLIIGFMNSLTCLPLLWGELAVQNRERHSGMYGPVIYILGSTVAELPYVLFGTTASMGVLFSLMGFVLSAWSFVKLILFFFAYYLFSVFLGHFMISATGSVPISTICAIGVNTGLVLFSGFMIAVDQVPSYFHWVTVISPTRYLTSGLVNTLLGCESCSVDLFTAFLPIPTCNGGQNCSSVCDQDSRGCSIIAVGTPLGPFQTTAWEYASSAYGYEPTEWHIDFVAILAAVYLFRFLDILALYFVKHDKK